MKVWIRLLACVFALGFALAAPSALAEVAQWAGEQTLGSAAELRRLNQQEALGIEVDASKSAKDITGQCAIRVSEGDRKKLTNGTVADGWSYRGASAWIGVKLPEDETPGAIRIEFRFEPTGYELIEYDAGQNPLRTRTLADSFPSIYTVFALLPETRLIQLKLTEADQVVVNLKVYSEGLLPNDVQTWLPPVEKADMLVFSTHQDDEVIFLGGTIPYSDVVCARPTVTVYMTNCSRNRRREALECLWVMGSRHYPEFINLTDEKVSSIQKGIVLWGGKDNILKEMVARIRRYKPEVIVTQDFNGEYGHNQHKIMARATPYAIEAAADPSRYPESYRQYGAWQVKKLYIHLYKENEIRMDWLTPQPACGGLTLLKVAQNGMAKHASQTRYYSVKDGGQYDNARFGLYMTTVGDDVSKNDFFENIPQDASAQYLAAAATGLAETEAAEDSEGLSADEDLWSGDAESESDYAAGEEALAPEPAGEDPDALTEAADGIDAEAPGEDYAENAPSTGSAGASAGEAAAARGGGLLAVALIGAGVIAAGGGWYFYRRAARRRRGRAKPGAHRSGAAASARKRADA